MGNWAIFVMKMARTALMANAEGVADVRTQLLALWHARRRELDELLEPLLAYGPVAAARVVEHLAEVTVAADNERAAFQAFLAAHELSEAERSHLAHVGDDELARARLRFAEAKAEARRFVHPSVTEALIDADPEGTVHRLPLHVVDEADED